MNYQQRKQLRLEQLEWVKLQFDETVIFSKLPFKLNKEGRRSMGQDKERSTIYTISKDLLWNFEDALKDSGFECATDAWKFKGIEMEIDPKTSYWVSEVGAGIELRVDGDQVLVICEGWSGVNFRCQIYDYIQCAREEGFRDRFDIRYDASEDEDGEDDEDDEDDEDYKYDIYADDYDNCEFPDYDGEWDCEFSL